MKNKVNNKVNELKQVLAAVEDFIIGVAMAVVTYFALRYASEVGLREEYRYTVTFSAALIGILAAVRLYQHFKSVKK